MSWDLMVFSFPDPQSDPETGEAILPDWDDEVGPPVFGTGREIKEKICEVFPDFVWKDDSVGSPNYYEGPTGSIEFPKFDADEPVSNFMLICHGNPARQIVHLAHETGWNIWDLTSGKWMHDTGDPNEGPASYLEFKRKVTTSDAGSLEKAPKKNALGNLLGMLWKRH